MSDKTGVTIKITPEDRKIMDKALVRANSQNMFKLNMTTFLIWLVKRYLAE